MSNYCPSCGASLNSSYAYCPSCGAKINSTNSNYSNNNNNNNANYSQTNYNPTGSIIGTILGVSLLSHLFRPRPLFRPHRPMGPMHGPGHGPMGGPRGPMGGPHH